MRGMERDRLRAAAALMLLIGLAVLLANPPTPSPPPNGEPEANVSAEIRVFFSPPVNGAEDLTGGADEALIGAIDEALASVDMAVYNLNLWRVTQALARAQSRGVQVRMVVESDNRLQSEIQDLALLGVPIAVDDRQLLMHHKFVVIDRAEVWTGSMNLTVNGVYRNNNNLIAIESSDLAASYTREFEEMFAEDRFGALSRPDTPYPFLTVGAVAIEVAFSPEDGVQARLLRTLDLAQRRVDVLAFSLTADPIAEALIRAHERGVEVRVVVEADRSQRLGSDASRLIGAGVDVRRDSNPFTMHHKVMIVDDQTVVTGSYNFSRSAEEQNDENVLIISDRDLAAVFTAEFERIYDASLR